MEPFFGADHMVDVFRRGVDIDLHLVDQPQKNFKYVWLDFCVCDFHAGKHVWATPRELPKKILFRLFKLGALCALAQVL